MANRPDIIRKLAESAGPEFLKSICKPMPEIAKVASVFAAMERETETSLQRWVAETAAETLASDDLSAADKNIVAGFLEDFKICFDYVVGEQGGKTAALGAIEAAFAIAVIAPHNEDIAKKVRRKGTEPTRDKAAEIARKRSKEIADAFRKVAERDGIPLRAGDKYIDFHFRGKLGEFLPKGFQAFRSPRTERNCIPNKKGANLTENVRYRASSDRNVLETVFPISLICISLS